MIEPKRAKNINPKHKAQPPKKGSEYQLKPQFPKLTDPKTLFFRFASRIHKKRELAIQARYPKKILAEKSVY